MKRSLILAVLAMCFDLSVASPARAQSRVHAAGGPVTDISFTYSALRANLPVGNCGCFWMRGGSGEIAFPLPHHFSAVAELSGERIAHLPGLPSTGLSLVSVTAGPRYTYTYRHRIEPFGQALFGAVHGFDSYFPAASGPKGAASSFAMVAGLGLDVVLRKHLLLRPVQAEYQYMQLPNNAVSPADQQHDIRFSAGLVLRFTP